MRENKAIQNELMEISTIVAGIPFYNVFKTQEGYFSECSNNIINRAHTSIHGDLIQENMSTPYVVPDDYFSSLPYLITKKTSSSSFFKLLHLTNTSRKIAASILIFLSGLLSFYFFYTNSNSSIQKEDTSAIFAEAKQIIANNSFEQELAKVDAADIEEYLTSNGHDVNAALVASVENDEEIPNEEDLLMDDQAIDQLYKDLNLSSNTLH